MSFSAGCTIWPFSTLMPAFSGANLRQLRSAASRCTYGRIAAQIACDDVCGTAPGMLVTAKWVTPSTTEVGLAQVVGFDVSKQPPWSIEMSTSTLPGSIALTIERVTTCGAFALG